MIWKNWYTDSFKSIEGDGIEGKIPSKTKLINTSQYASDKQTLEKKTEDVDQKMPNTNSLVLKKTLFLQK